MSDQEQTVVETPVEETVAEETTVAATTAEPAPVEAQPEVSTLPPIPTPTPAVLRRGPETCQDMLVRLYGADIMTPEIQQHVGALNDYAIAMAPNRPINADTIQSVQINLYQTIVALLSSAGISPVMGGTILVWFFNTHRYGAFSRAVVHRGVDTLRISEAEKRGFKAIVTALGSIAPPLTRQYVIRSFDINKLAQSFAHQPSVAEGLAAYLTQQV